MSTSNHLSAIAGLIRGAAGDIPDPSYIAVGSYDVSVFLSTFDDLLSWAAFLQAPSPTLAEPFDGGRDVWETHAVWAGLGGIATRLRLTHITPVPEGVAS